MLDFPRWKQAWYWLLTLIAVVAAMPSLFALNNVRWPDFLPAPMVNLGLDLAGGSHILLEADTAQVARQRLETMEESVRARMRLADPVIRISDISTKDGRLSFLVEDPTKVDAAREQLLPLTSGAGLTGQRDWDIQVQDGTRFVLTPTQAGIDLAVTQAMETATEVVRKRIDALGTREPTIIRSGDQRIVVQVPGLKDPQALKSCWARRQSSNSSWSIPRPRRPTLPRALPLPAARSFLMPIRARAGFPPLPSSGWAGSRAIS